MLYVSRRFSYGSYGVVDTDDNIEQRVGLIELSSICHQLDIKGVNLDRGKFNGVNVYQADMYRSTHQAKVSLLLHVDVTVWRNIVTRIHWIPERVESPVTIRLSEFGSECSAGILLANQDSYEHKLTIVLDDYIKFDKSTFNPDWNRRHIGMMTLGVMFDIRGLSDNDLALIIYDAVTYGLRDKFDACKSIIDSPERTKYVLQQLGCISF